MQTLKKNSDVQKTVENFPLSQPPIIDCNAPLVSHYRCKSHCKKAAFVLGIIMISQVFLVWSAFSRSFECSLLDIKLKKKSKVSSFFYSDSYKDNSVIRVRFTLSDKYAGMTLGGIAAPGGDLWRV